VHSSKAVGEPPFFLGAAVFFAIRGAVEAAQHEHGQRDGGDAGGAPLFADFHAPATTERIRMACGDAIGDAAIVAAGGKPAAFRPDGSC
jgi:xanthine dehydrogenase/oxidase